MPTDLDFVLYFNIAFISILVLGMLFGFLRGFKKSIWHFFVTLLFYAIFFVTLNTVVNMLWGMNMPFLGGLLGNVMPSLSSATSFEEAVSLVLQDFLGVGFEDSLTSNFSDLVTSVGVFALKIVYTILYFTVIQIIYRLIFWILRMIIFPSKKKTDKYKSKNRGLGAVFGLLTGAISLYVSLIIFGGLISISDSLLQVMPEPAAQPVAQIEMFDGFPNPNDTIINSEPVIQIGLDDPQLLASIDLITDMVDAYNNNMIVTTQNAITMPSAYTGEEMPMNLYLFDSVLSMDYQDEQIAIREELAVFGSLAGELLESDYFDTGVLSDITGTDISNLFNGLSESNLITTLLPIAVEVGTYYVETDLTIPVDDLYAIEWDEELATLGQIAATAFDLVNAAGILTDGIDLNTVTLEAEDVENLFDSLGQSDLVTLAAYVAVEPLLEQVGGTVAQIITIPDGVNWANEFAALGDLANEILSTDITIGEISGGDPTVLLGYLSEIDFTVIQNSEIISTAIINILSGQTDINVSFLAVPTDIDWDTELENILLAINTLAQQVAGIDFEDFQNLSFETIALFDLTAINAIFESEILVATITKYLRELDLGDEFSIIIPDSALDDDRLYLLKTELQNIVTAADVIVKNMQCDDGDDACAELGFDITKMLALEDDDIDTLLLPEILAATVGNLLLDLGSDVLTIPGEALTEITVDLISQDVVSRDEIKFAFQAISSLGITDIDDIEVDASILNVLAYDRYYFDNDENILDLDDVIVYTKGLTGDYTDSSDNVYTINTVTGDLEDDLSEVVVSSSYLFDTKVLAEAADLELDTNKSDNLTGSKILMATLTKYLIDFAEPTDGSEAMIVVPYFSELSAPIRILDTVDGTTERIHEDEIEYILRAILALNITDFENFELDLDNILANVSTLLDSSILHATVSKQLMDLGDPIVVPEKLLSGGNLLVTVGTGEEENTYIAKSELQAAFDALSALGITDITDVNIDISILDNLELDETALDTRLAQSTKDDLFGSTIINATLSKFLIDFAEPTDGSESLIVVPYINELNQTVRTEALDGTQYIVEEELIYILEAILALGLTDFDAFETLDLENDLIPNLEQLLDSAILHATVSKQLIDLVGGEDSFIKVPQNRLNGDPLRFTKGDPLLEEDTEFIARQELIDTFDSLIVLGVTDIAEVDIDVSILENLAMDRYYFDNNDNIVNLDDVIIYTYIGGSYIDGESNQFTINGVTGDLENTLSEVIIESAYLYDTKLEAEDGDLVLSDIKKDDLLGSTIINATLSYFMIDFAEPGDGSDPLIVVPFIDENDATIRTTEADGTEFISVDELTNILKAILALNISDFNNVETLNLETQIIPHLDTLLSSAIMHATISKQLLDQVGGEGSVVIVPENRLNGDPLKFIKGDPLLEEDTEFISSDELIATFDALIALGITDIVNGLDIGVDILTNLAEDPEAETLVLDQYKKDDLFGSTIINATLSKFILDEADKVDAFIVVPTEDQALNTVRFTDVADGTEFIHQDELTNLVEAILALNLTDFESVESFSLDTIIENKTVLLDSAILHASISKQLIDLGSDLVTIPEYFEDNTELQLTRGTATLIHRTELEATFDALKVLNLGLGNVSMSIAIINELAYEVYYKDIDDNLVNLDDEIVYTWNNMGFYTDADENIFTINVGSGDLENVLAEVEVYSRHLFDTKLEAGEADAELDTDNKSPLLFGSTIIKATISKYIIDQSVSDDPLVEPFLIVPYFDEDGGDLRNTTIDLVDILIQDELEAILDAVLALGLADFNVDALSFDTIIAKKSTLLASSILQATISDQIIELGSGVIEVPYKDETNLIDIVKTPGDGLEETTYISYDELNKLLDSMEILELGNIEEFNGNTIDLNDLSGQEAVFVDSAIIQATISKQVIDLVSDPEPGATTLVVIPYKTDIGDIDIRRTVGIVGHETEMIKKTELVDLIEGFLLLEFGNVDDMGDPISLSTLADNSVGIFESYIIQATVSKQVIDLGSAVTIPYLEDDNSTRVRNTSGPVGFETEFISKSELSNLVNALKKLNEGTEEDDLNNFDGAIDLNIFFTQGNRDILLASSIMQATISDQVIAVSQVVAPYYSDDDAEEIRFSVGLAAEVTEYISIDEIHRLFESLEVLGFGAIDDLEGAIVLDNIFESTSTYPTGYEDAQDVLLASRVMQATISDQIKNVGGTLRIPTEDQDNVAIKVTNLTSDFYIYTTEIKHMFNALDVLGVSNIGIFDGNVSISSLFSTDPDYLDNRTTMLSSAIIHATMTDQIDAIGTGASSTVSIPTIDIDEQDVKYYTTVSSDYYIVKDEIKYLLTALEVFGFTGGAEGDIGDFSGVDDFSVLGDSGNQTTILNSAIMHATLSDKLLGVDDNVLIVPMHTEASETSADLIRITKSGTEFIVKDEIKHILYALNDMQVLNFEATTIDSSKFFEDPDTYLLSSSIQATISKKIIDINTNPLDPMLIFPDEDIRRDPDEVIYIEHTDVHYIELVELKALLASLDALTLTNFSSVTIDATSILGQTHENYVIIFGSAIMQATVSDRIIENAKDEDTVTTAGQLIIPKAKKETIEVDAVPVKWIEHDELIYLVEALDIMGVDFSGSVDGDIFSGKEAGDIDDVLLSATMHITFNYMIQDNSSIDAPNLALVGGNTSGSIYGITNVVTALEIRKFIVAVNQIGGDIGAEVTFAAISTLNKTQRDVAIDSMIIRLKITPNLEAYMTAILDPYDSSDYEVGSSPQFVIYLSSQDTLDAIAGD